MPKTKQPAKERQKYVDSKVRTQYVIVPKLSGAYITLFGNSEQVKKRRKNERVANRAYGNKGRPRRVEPPREY